MREWDAKAYHRISGPQFEWGLKVLDRLHLVGGETVLDAGCGSGRLTEVLLERLPRGSVIALDISRQMLEMARSQLLPRAEGRVSFVLADLAKFTLERQVDIAFSAATFHWVLDQDGLFASLFRSLRPGGALVAQCGGTKNLQRIHDRAQELMQSPQFADAFEGWTDPFYFSSPEEAERRMKAAGFADARAWLEEAPTPFEGAEAFREFIERVVLRVHLSRLGTPQRRAAFLDGLVAAYAKDAPPYQLDYWRLNLEARRPER